MAAGHGLLQSRQENHSMQNGGLRTHNTYGSCAVVFVVPGDVGPLLLSPCNTYGSGRRWLSSESMAHTNCSGARLGYVRATLLASLLLALAYQPTLHAAQEHAADATDNA